MKDKKSIKYIQWHDDKFYEDELEKAKKYFVLDDKEVENDEFAKWHNDEIKEAENLEQLTEAYNHLTDDYGDGEPIKIYEYKYQENYSKRVDLYFDEDLEK